MDNITLGQIRLLHPALAERFKMEVCDTYEDFIDVLYSALDRVCRLLEQNAGKRADDGEDRLTLEIISCLCMAGFNATHDALTNGHCDIRVEHRCGFVWLGEAKIHGSYTWLEKGFDQLCARYSNGGSYASQGGLIIYIRTGNALSVINTWRGAVAGLAYSNLTLSDCSRSPQMAFYSEHTHQTSGLPYKVRHIGVLMHYAPIV